MLLIAALLEVAFAGSSTDSTVLLPTNLQLSSGTRSTAFSSSSSLDESHGHGGVLADVAQQPPMGWNPWNCFGVRATGRCVLPSVWGKGNICKTINEDNARRAQAPSSSSRCLKLNELPCPGVEPRCWLLLR